MVWIHRGRNKTIWFVNSSCFAPKNRANGGAETKINLVTFPHSGSTSPITEWFTPENLRLNPGKCAWWHSFSIILSVLKPHFIVESPELRHWTYYTMSWNSPVPGFRMKGIMFSSPSQTSRCMRGLALNNQCAMSAWLFEAIIGNTTDHKTSLFLFSRFLRPLVIPPIKKKKKKT